MKPEEFVLFGAGFFMLIFIISIIGIFLAIFIPILVTVINKRRYKNFVIEHSVALKQLAKINSRYQFKSITHYDLYNSYDNENFYNEISCQDYLTYQLVYIQKKVKASMKDTLDNAILYDEYKKEVQKTCHIEQFDSDKVLSNKNRLNKLVKEYFKKAYKRPTTSFSIFVKLTLTDINGYPRGSKSNQFYPKEIEEIIYLLNMKDGDYYVDNDIWKAICRVERGKVTNRMRFAIYERDHYRCRKCGRSTDDLEVDHIIPISKGGKSTYDNLQTLCHRCNYDKGSKIE